MCVWMVITHKSDGARGHNEIWLHEFSMHFCPIEVDYQKSTWKVQFHVFWEDDVVIDAFEANKGWGQKKKQTHIW